MNDLLENTKILFAFWDIIKRRDFLLGESVILFEKKIAAFLGVPYVLGVASGTDAVILSLKALGVGYGDEVIVAATGFISTASSVSWVNARPVFVDVELESFNMDAKKIEQAITKKTKAILVTHLNGRMADMEKIAQVAKRYSLYVVEDAAQATGAKYNSCPVGYYGDIACLSFNPTKNLAAFGDGGAVVTKNAVFAGKIAMMRTYGANGLKEVTFYHDSLGVSSRLSSLQAAVLSIRLDRLSEIIEKYRRNYFLYSKLLDGVSNLVLPDKESHSNFFINGHKYVVLSKKRDALLKFLKDNKVDVRNHYSVPLPYLVVFKNLGYKKGDFPNSDRIAEESLVLPTHHSLSEKEIINTAELIRRFYGSKTI